MKYAIIIVYSIVALKGVFAMEYEKASIALVTNFLVRIEMDKPLSFDEEEHFFDRSLVGASLYIQYGYMREDGGWRWLFKPRKSLLGNIIQAHRDVFSTREFDHKNVLYVKDNDYYSSVIVVLHKEPHDCQWGWPPIKPDRNPYKVMKFSIAAHRKKPKIELSESLVDGVSVLYQLGFRERSRKVLRGKKMKDVGEIYYAEELPNP